MDRLIHWRLASCGLGLMLATTGCRSTPSPVPPGRQFSNDGAPAAAFGSAPHPGVGPSYGTAAPGATTPTTGLYGPAPTTSPYGPEAAANPYGPAPTATPDGMIPNTGPNRVDPAATGAAGYGIAPATTPSGSGAPDLRMNPAPGTTPTIPENLSGIPAAESPR